MAALTGFDSIESPQLRHCISTLASRNSNSNQRNGLQEVSLDMSAHKNSDIRNNYNDCGIPTTNKTKDSSLRKLESVTLSWRNISLSTRKGETVLRDLNGIAMPGELTAIMGPSEAEKSTLLDILSGFSNHKHSGKVLVNEKERRINNFRNLSRYISREIELHDLLSVEETVTFAASLKLPNAISNKEKKEIVQSVIDSSGLGEVRNVRAGKLSEGDRKKLCIAQDIVDNPAIIFLEEPTSGLDASSSFQCVKLLKYLAGKGRTVVCTMHQPSSNIFSLFDKLYLLKDGQCRYHGSTEELVPFLSEHGFSCPQYYNPADYVTEVLMGEHGNMEWKTKKERQMREISSIEEMRPDEVTTEGSTFSLMFLENSDKIHFENNNGKLAIREKPSEQSDKMRHSTSFFNQLKVLSHRNYLNFIRNPNVTHLQILANIIGGLFIGVSFFGIGSDPEKMRDNIGFMYLNPFFIIYTAMGASVLSFCLEKNVVSREYRNNWYSTNAYFMSRCIMETPYQMILPLLHSSIVYWMTQQPPEAFRFWLFVVANSQLFVGAQAMSMVVAAIFEMRIAILVGSAIFTLPSIFSGCLIRLSVIPLGLRALAYISNVRYVIQAYIFSVYAMNGTETAECSTEECISRQKIMDRMDVNDDDYYIYFGVPAIFIFVLRTMSFFILHIKMNYIKRK